MKKQFTTLFLFAAAMLVGTALTACSSDENETVLTQSGITEFSAGTEPLDVADGTRTSLDTAYNFHWENGDKIYVKKNGEWKPSAQLSLTERQSFAKFTVGETFTDGSVDVIYIGQNGTVSGASASVTIAASQEQKAWNVATHLGQSGDCGTATATRNAVTGTYSFTLTHKASYLILYPYLDASQSGYNLTSIDIEALGGTELAGTFAFGAGSTGISGAATSGGTNKVTLTLGTGGAGLPLLNTTPTKADGNHCYAVIRPGDHNLKITYNMVNPSDASDVLTITKGIGSRRFNPNGVTTIAHNLKENEENTGYGEFDFTIENTYYMWDAQKWYWDGVENFPYTSGATKPGTNPTTENGRLNNTNVPTASGSPIIYNTSLASYSAKDMPCYYALLWYLKDGVYFDNTTEWTLTTTTYNYTHTRTGGIWLKKWNYITGKPANYTLSNCPTSPNNVNVPITYQSMGKPADSEIEQWFFLPAMGYYNYISWMLDFSGQFRGYYWSSSGYYASYSNNPTYFYLTFLGNNDHGTVRIDGQTLPGTTSAIAVCVAGKRANGKPWFQ